MAGGGAADACVCVTGFGLGLGGLGGASPAFSASAATAGAPDDAILEDCVSVGFAVSAATAAVLSLPWMGASGWATRCRQASSQSISQSISQSHCELGLRIVGACVACADSSQAANARQWSIAIAF